MICQTVARESSSWLAGASSISTAVATIFTAVAAYAAWKSATIASEDQQRRLAGDQQKRANRRAAIAAEVRRLMTAIGDQPPSMADLRRQLNKRLVAPSFNPWIQALIPELAHDEPDLVRLLAVIEHALEGLADRRQTLDNQERIIGAAKALLDRCGFFDGKLTSIPAGSALDDVKRATQIVKDDASEAWMGMDVAWEQCQQAIATTLEELERNSHGW